MSKFKNNNTASTKKPSSPKVPFAEEMMAGIPQQLIDLFSQSYSFDAPASRSYADEISGALSAQVNIAPQQFAAEQEFRPQYAQLDHDIYASMMPQYLRAQRANAPLQSEITALLRGGERDADMADVMRLGPDALAAIKASNPDAAALLDEMTRQAQRDVELGKGLSASERREVVQNTRSGFADRGMAVGNPAIFAEVMGLDQFGRGREADRRKFAGDVLGYHKSIYGDPWQMILGRPSSNLGFAAGNNNIPATAQQGAQLFNPESGYAGNLFSQNYAGAMQGAGANQQGSMFGASLGQDLFNTMFNANASAAINQQNNAAALQAAKYSALGSAAGGLFQGIGAALCWIARAAYGPANPRWVEFRRWLITRAPDWFVAWYCKYGPEIGEKLATDPEGRRAVRAWMDGILRKAVANGI